MKLTFAIHDLNTWGGQDRSTLEIARRLSHHWPVEVLAFTMHDPQLKDWGNLTFRQVKPNLRRPVLAKTLYYQLATLLLHPWINHSHRLVHATGAVSAVNNIIQVQFIQTAWRAIREEVVKQNASALPARPMLREIYHHLLSDLNILFERRIYNSQNRYIAIADGVASDLRKYFGITSQIDIIRHGVDAVGFHPASQSAEAMNHRRELRGKYGIGEQESVLVFVGAYERKGLSVAIEAMARLTPQVRSLCRLVAVGSGPTESYRAQAAQAGVADRVLFIGHQKEIRPYYWMSDLFVLPTLYEPFGLVTMEAMACGLPAIVSRNTGASELMIDHESGSLIDDPSSAQEVAMRISDLVQNKNRQSAMAEKARAIAAARTWDVVADEYAAVIAECEASARA